MKPLVEPDHDDEPMERMRPKSVNGMRSIGDIARAQGQKPEMNLTNTIVSPNGVLSEAQAGVRPLEHPEAVEPVGVALVEGAEGEPKRVVNDTEKVDEQSVD